MKKFVPVAVLVGVAFLSACSTESQNNDYVTPSGDAYMTQLEHSGYQLEPNPASNPSAGNIVTEQLATGERTPLAADHPFWDLHGPDADLTICPVTHAIWDGDTQITFPRGDDVFVPDLPGGGEPIEPGAGPRPQLVASNMRVGQYPAHWRDDRNAYVRYVDFYADMQAHNSNMSLQGTLAQLGAHEWVGLQARSSMVWHNDTVSVGIIRLENPEDGVWGRMSVQAWFTNGRDPDTGDMSFDNFEIFYTDDMWAINPAGFGFGRPFAEQVWDVIAMLDTAQSMSAIEAVQRAFGTQTGTTSQITIPQPSTPAAPPQEQSFSIVFEADTLNVVAFDMQMAGSIIVRRASTLGVMGTVIGQSGNQITVEIASAPSDDSHKIASAISRRGKLTFASEDGDVLLTGAYVAEATTISQGGQHFISIELNEQGTAAFATATLNNMGRTIRIYLDNELLATPMISVPIIDGRIVIAGDFTEETANSFASLIHAGALPFNLIVVSIE